MLHLGPCLAFGGVGLFVPLAQGLIAVRPLVGEVFGLWRCLRQCALSCQSTIDQLCRFGAFRDLSLYPGSWSSWVRQLNSGIHNSAAAQFEAVGQQKLSDFGKDGCAQLVRLQQVAKVQERGGIGYSSG